MWYKKLQQMLFPAAGTAFREEINGLRAMAVLAVLFYHFGIPGFGGGYVGVDVFFVISGFLMTQIICTKLVQGKFTLAGFYAARARRILPALAAVIAVLLAGGAFYLPPMDYKSFGWQALSALTFTSNIVFGHRGDYFDTASQESWLLHTWSLSVEWQFYLLLPLFLMGLYRYRNGKYLKRGVISVFSLSLLLAVIITPLRPTDAFFLLPTRTWELLAGALVFFTGTRFSKVPYLTEIGLALIFAAVFLYSSDLEFPGHWAILPVVGTAFVIVSQKRGIFLGNKAVQFFGSISYSLYLWHWPVMVGARYFGVAFTALNVIVLLGAVFLLSWISFSYIEEPFRYAKKRPAPRAFTATALGFYAGLSLLVWGVFLLNGVPARVPADVLAAELDSKNIELQRPECQFNYKKKKGVPECRVGYKGVPSVVIWGDSHANASALALMESLTDKKRAALLYSYRGCPPILDAVFATKWKKHQCAAINQLTYDKIITDKKIKDVFLVSRWSVYLHGYNEKGSPHPYIVFDDDMRAYENNLAERSELYSQKMVETMCGLRKSGKNVYAVAPFPEMGRRVPTLLARSRLILGRDVDANIVASEYAQRNAGVLEALKKAEKVCGVRILEPRPYLCDTDVCFGVKEGKSLYFDDNHLSEFGNSLMKPMFIKALQRH